MFSSIRRVVSWLDYRDLVAHNVGVLVPVPSASIDPLQVEFAAGFGIDDVQETIRIFPMTLRIVRYSRPPRPPPGANPCALIYRLPIIHVAGESRGTDTDETLRRVV